MQNQHHRARYWADMITVRRAGGEPQVKRIGPAVTDEELDVMIAQEWRRAERAGLMVADIRETTEE
jgi:hypothetical protein